MGPTCSLIYENEPVSRAEIARPVSTQNSYLLVSSQLWVTLMQGLMITAGCLLAGSWTNHQGGSEVEVRSAVFTTLVLSNIFLTLANRSFTQTVISTIRRRNRLIPLISLVSLLLLAMILYIPALNSLFDVQAIPLAYSWIFLLAALFFSLWLEPFKGRARWVSG